MEQHTDKIEMLQVMFNICDMKCTLEFQPNADRSCQSSANTNLSQAPPYPSPYANVSKGNMCTMGNANKVEG